MLCVYLKWFLARAQIDADCFRRSKEWSCGGNDLLMLAAPKRERLGLSSRCLATYPHGRSICYRLDHTDIACKLARH